ncbi:hypothetical protein ACFQRD_02190 [Brachybacterium sp. GCM10030268]|uniref:hypothetical protein n=1 Tax=Brachybacterium sp. GCM10030268 TaxID=3273382 RepID=UPI0036208A29
MRRTILPSSRCAAVMAGLVLALASCSSPPADDESAAPETTTEASASPTENPEAAGHSEEPTTQPADSGLVELELGDTFTTDLGSEITAHEVRLNIPYDWESDGGGAWHAVDVSYCLSDTVPDAYAFQSFTMDWIMRTEEGYVLDFPSSHSDDIVQPLLDLYSAMPAANECYRGWVLIDGPPDVEITSVRFLEVDWAVSPSE